MDPEEKEIILKGVPGQYYIAFTREDIPGFNRIDTEISAYLGIKDREIIVGLDKYDERLEDLNIFNLEFMARIKNNVPIPVNNSLEEPMIIPIFIYYRPEEYPHDYYRIKTIDTNSIVKVWEVIGDKIVTYDEEISREDWPNRQLCILAAIKSDDL